MTTNLKAVKPWAGHYGGFEDEPQKVKVVKRHCAKCGCPLSRYNHDLICAPCARSVEDAKPRVLYDRIEDIPASAKTIQPKKKADEYALRRRMIYNLVAANGPVTTLELAAITNHRAKTLRDSLRTLREKGYINSELVSQPRRQMIWWVRKEWEAE